MAEDNALLAIVKSARVLGKDYVEIERLYGISAPRAEALIKAHYANVRIDPNEYRMLQMDRLEGLIDVLMSMAQMGNIKSAEVLLKALEQINVLLGLNLEQTKIEIRVVTEQQSNVVYEIVAEVTKNILGLVQRTVTDQKQLAAIEEVWDAEVDTSFGDSAERIIAAVVVE